MSPPARSTLRWIVLGASLAHLMASGCATSPSAKRPLSARPDSVPEVPSAGEADPATVGAWTEQTSFDFIPIHAVLLPDGRILTYGGSLEGGQGGHQSYDVWDPGLGVGVDAHIRLPNTTNVDSFCSGMLLMPQSGRVLAVSGDSRGVNEEVRNREVLVYDASQSSVRRLSGRLRRQRWYVTPVMTGKGEIVLFGGTCWGEAVEGCSDDTRHIPEIYRPEAGWSYLHGVEGEAAIRTFAEQQGDNYGDFAAWYYPRAFLFGTGEIYVLSVGRRQGVVSLKGAGGFVELPEVNLGNFGVSNSAVMFAPNRVLFTGGGAGNTHGLGPGTTNANIVDLSSGQPVWTSASSMHLARQWHSSNVLPDGTVLVTGGSKTNLANMWEDGRIIPPGAKDVSLATGEPAYAPEIWDPRSNTWAMMAPEAEVRSYHSSAILLLDGRVVSMGGGAPGPKIQKNGAIFSPPYLFKPGMRNRLEITSGPDLAEWGETYRFTVNDGARVERVTAVGFGAGTHSMTFGTRFHELRFERDGDDLWITTPSNQNTLPPGYYMIFLLDPDDVPSVAHVVRVLGKDTVASPDIRDRRPPNPAGSARPHS